MPRAPILGQRGGQPLAYSSWDIADEPSQALMGRGTARPGGFGRSAMPMGGKTWMSGAPGDRWGLKARGGQPVPPGGGPAYRTDPWSPEDPFGGFPNLETPIQGLIAQGGKEGVFRPDYLINLLRKRVMMNADAQRGRTASLARLSGLDPMQYRGAMVDADIAANAGQVGALNEAELQGGQAYQDLITRLLMGERKYGYDTEANNIANRNREDAGGGFGGFLGGVLGTGLGAFAGGLGQRLGGGRRQILPEWQG